MRVSDIPLGKLIPPSPPACPHLLGRWLVKTTRSTQAYPDGGLRPPELRGGRLALSLTRGACTRQPNHPGKHVSVDGRTWT